MLNLLDGLRDLKAPLAAGVILLFGTWLIFANSIAEAEPGESMFGNIRRLTDYIGVPATLGVVAFLAYVLGLVLSLHTVVLYIAGRVTYQQRLAALPEGTRYRLVTHVYQVIGRAYDQGHTNDKLYDAVQPPSILAPLGQVLLKRNRGRLNIPVKRDKAVDREKVTTTDLLNYIAVALSAETDLLAAQLQTAKDKSYEQYDKSKTEADFRASIVVPLLFVGAVACVRLAQENLVWIGILTLLTTAAVSVRLVVTALARLREANAVIVNALILGHVDLYELTVIKKLGETTSESPVTGNEKR